MTQNDEVLHDALMHEFESCGELYISGAYVATRYGDIATHTNLDEYGKMYSLLALMTRPEPLRYSVILGCKRTLLVP